MQPTTTPATPKTMRGMHSRDGAPVAREPLLQEQGNDEPGDSSFPRLATAAMGCLAFSCGWAVYRSRGDPGAVAFVAFSHLDLALLLCCLWWYERAEPGSKLSHSWMKAAIWLLAVALTFVFAYRVAAVMPPAYAVVLWVVALASAAGGFVTFF